MMKQHLTIIHPGTRFKRLEFSLSNTTKTLIIIPFNHDDITLTIIITTG